MQCATAVSRMRIKRGNETSECSLRCSYKPIYTTTRVDGRNNIGNLEYSFGGEQSGTIYNGKAYTAMSMLLFRPGLHIFDDDTVSVSAELVINHTSDGGEVLNVCIPVEGGGTDTTILGNLINDTLVLPQDSVDPTRIDIKEFTLSTLIPQDSFYSYLGKNIFQSCNNDTVNFIVFHKDAAIKISTSIMTNVSNDITTVFADSAIRDVNYYFNAMGTTNEAFISTDDLYIDCRPTGSSDETTTVYTEIPEFDQKKISDQIAYFFVIFGSCIIIFFILWVIYQVSRHFASSSDSDST